ncbi:MULTISPECIES: sugar transferase [Bacillus]|uniref:Multidrug MFS transporter n=2 Tax=Bacillus TaxID=1386 RepID=A0A0M4FSC7_9BACI|nr:MULTISPECIES: sugar transferase [Bacillus]ALC82648.1 multidrug MFS transporter [Bacillus gobiensis]MBP1081591.1 lipopolysaccharide/colanic/teichoic acid biosynthesis glycosyltransferase [Bacillus capparidis]MED1096251.1 sugar transferase [Bacillus capparidis]
MDNAASKNKPLVNVEATDSNNSPNVTQKQSFLYLAIKRVVDIIGALAGLVVTAPMFILISLLYLFGDNKGPVFFCQNRVGKNGRIFKMFKFRSMIVNAEAVLKNNKDLYNKYLQNNYKLIPDEDPRITKIGRFLRKSSLDELPQLINVLKGEMSLVGPRPVIQEELKEYNHRLKDFLAVKPGVTGYWQICGRSQVGYPERANLEFYYIDHQGFKLDLRIIFNTFILVITRMGAY